MKDVRKVSSSRKRAGAGSDVRNSVALPRATPEAPRRVSAPFAGTLLAFKRIAQRRRCEGDERPGFVNPEPAAIDEACGYSAGLPPSPRKPGEERLSCWRFKDEMPFIATCSRRPYWGEKHRRSGNDPPRAKRHTLDFGGLCRGHRGHDRWSDFSLALSRLSRTIRGQLQP